MLRCPKSKAPLIQDGLPTSLLVGPKMVRTTCCRISDRPQVASSVSSGRPHQDAEGEGEPDGGEQQHRTERQAVPGVVRRVPAREVALDFGAGGGRRLLDL